MISCLVYVGWNPMEVEHWPFCVHWVCSMLGSCRLGAHWDEFRSILLVRSWQKPGLNLCDLTHIGFRFVTHLHEYVRHRCWYVMEQGLIFWQLLNHLIPSNTSHPQHYCHHQKKKKIYRRKNKHTNRQTLACAHTQNTKTPKKDTKKRMDLKGKI